MYFKRTIESRIKEISRQFPVLLVTGARQVGKTTLLKHLCEKDRHYVTLDDLMLRSMANNDPALFLQRFPPPVLIDEIQYAPSLLPYIKMEVDSTGKKGQFWLTGSQQFVMMKGITESLAGRVALIDLLGFSARERYRKTGIVDPFLPVKECMEQRLKSSHEASLKTVFKDIWTGSFPALVAGAVKDRDVFYSSYLQTYLQRDVSSLTQVGNQESFVRFMKACAARTGQMLNYSDLARDVDVSMPTIKSWISILVASYQVYLLYPYFSNITKRLVKRPKLYFMDTGLCAHLTGWSSPEILSSGAMCGAIFETYVFGEILKSWWHRVRQPRIYYYRDKDGKEIDFLLEHDGILNPVEAKLSATPKSDWAKPFQSLRKLKVNIGQGAVVCLYPEEIPLTRGITIVPVGLL